MCEKLDNEDNKGETCFPPDENKLLSGCHVGEGEGGGQTFRGGGGVKHRL